MITQDFAKSKIEKDFKALGTDIHAEIIVGSSKKRSAAAIDLEKVKEIYSRKQKIFCRFWAKSELTSINSKLGIFQKASPDILRVAKRALRYHRLSSGLYDPRVIEMLERIGYRKNFQETDFSNFPIPENFSKIQTGLGSDLAVKGDEVLFKKRMDFSGIVKGYITDCAAKFLKKRGWKDFLIDSGGDMHVAGRNIRGEKWKIEIEGIPSKLLMLQVSEKGIATSGISRKKWKIKGRMFHHLVNPKDPNTFSFSLRTVSVIEKDTENADGRAKVLMLLGREKGLKFAEKHGIAAIFLDYRGSVTASSEAKKYIMTN